MRRLRHLTPFLVLLSALLVASLKSATSAEDESSSIDKMANQVNPKESRNYSFLVETDDDLSMDPSSQIAQIIRGNPLHSNPPSSSPNTLGCNFQTKSCPQWNGLTPSQWYWVTPSFSQLKKDGPEYEDSDASTYPLQVNFTGSSSHRFNLTSPQFNTANSNVSCFSFNYYFLMDSTRENSLDVALSDQTQNNSNNTVLIWSTAGVDFDGWKRAEAQIDGRGSYKIILSAYASKDSAGFIAVKNFTLASGPCPTNICTFENGPCGFSTASNTEDAAFYLVPGSSAVGYNLNDHTTHTMYGHVMWAGLRRPGNKVTLTSPKMANLQTQCLKFYFLRGDEGVSLRLYEHHYPSAGSSQTDRVLWHSNGTHLLSEWIRVQQTVLLFTSDPVTLNWEAEMHGTLPAKIEIDDISLTPFQCDPPISCSFATDLCGWKAETTKSSLLWGLGRGRVLDPSKLKTRMPLITYRNVLYTDFTEITTSSHGSMELLSEVVDAPALGACVTFSYKVFSMSLDTDSLTLNQIDLSGNRTVLWSFKDSAKIGFWAWTDVKVFVAAPKTPSIAAYRLSLLASSANAGTYLGVRDVVYSTTDLGVCGGSTTSKPPGSTTAKTTTTTTLSPSKTLNCDFDRGTLCNWRSSTFKVTSPYSSPLKGMFFPFTDHSTSSRQGKVAYATGAARDYPESSSMTADNPFPFPKRQLCFSFYYYFYANGPSSFVLNMDRRDDSAGHTRQVPVFSGFGGNEDVWRQAIFTVMPNDTYSTFTFNASLQNAVLVLDDIVVRQGECLSSQLETTGKVCDFELNRTSCIFEPVFSAGQPTWAVYQGVTEGVADHTTHTANGHYYGLDLAAFGGRTSATTFRTSSVAAQAVDGTTYRCLQFSYLMANVLPNTTLNYYTSSGVGFGRQREHWSVAGSTLKMWFTRRAPLPSYRSTYLSMGIRTLGEPAGKVFIDDVRFLKTSCNNPHTCDFESGDIGNMGMIGQSRDRLSSSRSAYLAASPNGTALTVRYLTDYADQIWHVFTPRQSTSFVQYDNTVRNQYGHYLLLTAIDPSDRGMVVTERYNLAENGGKICLSFAVYKPSTQSVLEVYQGESFNETHGTKIWSISRTTNGRWETFEILAYPLQNSSVDLFFYLVGTLNDKTTYLGLDDLTIKPSCSNPSNVWPPTSTLPPGASTPTPNPDLYFTCKNGHRIFADLTCNYVDNCGDNSDEGAFVCGSCDFTHHSLCRYKASSVLGDFSFRFRADATAGPATGSDGDVNFLVASGHTGTAFLRSPTIHQSYQSCRFSFFYYWYDSSAPVTNNVSSTALKLYIQRTDLSGSLVLLWESSFQPLRSATWRSVSVRLGRVHHPFQLLFTADQSSGNPTEVHALDDLALRDCQPPTTFSSAACSSNFLFRCGNSVCISKVEQCDFEDNCGNGADEQNCPVNSMTSFESGLGLWGKGINANWRLTRSSQFTSLRQGPTYDHSTEEQSGSYLYAYAQTTYTSTSRDVIKTAEIDSPPFTPTNGNCQLRYYVFKNSAHSSLLAILQNVATGQRYELGEIAGDYAQQWVRHSSYLFRSSSTPNALFRVLFTARLNALVSQFVQPYIAIDDISFTPECTIHTGPVVMPTLPNHSTMTTPKADNCPGLPCISPAGHTVCLSAVDLCDFVQDCKDMSDEQNCGNCTFDGGSMCGWVNYQSSSNPWTVVRPARLSAGAFPKRDAGGQAEGGFLAVKMLTFSSTVPNSRLQSPSINGHTAATCKLRFSYFSSRRSFLSVRRFRWGVATLLFSLNRASVNQQWQSFQVDVGANDADFNLEFYGSSLYSFSSFEDMAIDSVQLLYCDPHQVYPTPPPSTGSLNCTFEQDLCGWSVTGPQQQQRSNWLRTSSPTKEPGNDADSLKYPKPSRYGTWMTTQSSSGDSLMPGKDYLISTVRLTGSTTYCFSFWTYFMSVNRYSSFGLYASKTGKASSSPDTDADYTALWRTDTPLSRNWNRRYVEIGPQSNSFYLLFIAAVDSLGIVGLDSTELIPGMCPTVSTEYCDFEINNCDWKLQSNGFQRNPNSVQIRDHTTGTTSGHFLQDTSTGNTAVMTKAMSSVPIFSNSNSNVRSQYFCLQFYYYMSTGFVNSGTMEDAASMLSVKIRRDGTNNNYLTTANISILDTYNEGQLNSWALYQQSFYAGRTGSIEIDALQAKSTTKLLLDDISVTQRRCQTGGSCDFEFDNCGWANQLLQTSSSGRSNSVLWLRIQPNSTRYVKGSLLHYDHTTQSGRGNYLLMPAMMAANAHSVLGSPLIRQKQSPVACFTMYYFAQGANTSVVALTVRLVDLGKQKSTAAYTLNATTSLYWVKAELEFDKVPTTYAFQIEGSYTNGLSSDIGIDDISVTPGKCSGGRQTLPPTTTTPVPPSEKRLDCTFDNGPCAWKYDSSAWKSGSFSALGNNYAPLRDHSSMTTTGRYLLFQANASTTPPQTTSYTISSTVNITAYDHKDHCLTMWYFEDGESAFGVDVFLVTPKFNVVASRFSSAIENRRRWNLLKADIAYDPSYKTNSIGLQILYTPTTTTTTTTTSGLKETFSIFALDDIAVRPGSCQHRHDYVYTMEFGLEDLELEFIQPLANVIGQTYKPFWSSVPGAPPVDHTTETNKGGYFLFINRNIRAPTAYISTLAMVDIPKDTSFSTTSCVRFAYQVVGNATLKVYVAPNNAFSYFYQYSSPIWTSKYSKDVWTIGELNIRALYLHKVVFYMEKQPDRSSYIALDDLTMLSHRCQTPIDCDFDGGRICSYSPFVNKAATTKQTFIWGLFTASPQDPNWPGPRVDHTGTSIYDGGYLYLSAYHSVGAFSAAIVSTVVSGPRTVNPNQKYCLSLWTVLSAKGLGLRLSLIRYGPSWVDSNRTTTTIASKSNTVESNWTRMAVSIDQSMLVGTYELQLVFEGTIGVNSRGGIFIDDILLVEGACQQTNLVCEDGTPIRPEQICNFVKDCKSGLDELNCGTALCNFETNSCGWGNMTTYSQKWLLTSARQARLANRNAPRFDGDAKRSGHYLLVSNAATLGSMSNAEAALNFPQPALYLKNAYQSCVMQFDYYISSSPKVNYFSYSLSVRIGRDRTDWSTVYYIGQAWSLNAWNRAYAHIGERNSQFMADILGHLDNSQTSAMAVDNIQFVNCSMPAPLGPNQKCPAGQFMCRKYRFCVSTDRLCNYKNDCGDASDEVGCSRYTRCNFELSLQACRIKTDDMEANNRLLDINVQWSVRRGRSGDLFEPKIDNTLRTGSGQYLALEKLASFGQKLKQTFTSEFYSPMMTSKVNACRMRFFYFINGEPETISATHLEIFIRYANKRTAEPKSILKLHLNISGDLQQRWNFAAAQFTSTAPFQFVFRGVLGTNRSRIAVDDISFDPSGCQASAVSPVTPTTSTTTTTGQPVTGQSRVTDGTTPPVTMTPKPGVGHRQSPDGNTGGKIAAGILIPLFVILGAIGGYFAYQKYQKSRARGDEHITLSMRNIQEKEEEKEE